MARMLPAEIYQGTSSPGEVEIFERLRKDPQTQDWVVLHSLDVVHHLKQVVGEIDFVVVISGMGVLCIEVKAHRKISCEQGLWYFGESREGSPRSPFRQASEAMHSIRTRLIERHPELGNVVFWSACIFPYVEFTAESEEWHPWQVIDRYTLLRQPVSQSLMNVVREARYLLKDIELARWFHPGSNAPDNAQCHMIVETLRPEFEFFQSPQARTRELSNELKKYTAEQFIALDAMEANERVIFEGPAGTGKTMLAIEAARRSRGQGRRVLLLCFNRLLGRWLEAETTGLVPEVTTRTIHRHMLHVAGLPSNQGEERGSEFWQDELPDMAINRLLDGADPEMIYDEIIIDEAQDILRDSYLDFLDLSVRGGLSTGRWLLFGDFEKQAIYGTANLSLDDLQKRARHVPVYRLRVNCRNTPRIAEYTHLLGGLNPGYLRILRPDDGVEPRINVYTDAMHHQEALVKALSSLYEEGFRGNDIIVLSPKKDLFCAASGVDEKPWRDRLRPVDEASHSQIPYASIHSYKGMEAPAVILTDIEHVSGPEAVALFYIGITRALHRLVILMHDSVRNEVLAMTVKKPDPATSRTGV